MKFQDLAILLSCQTFEDFPVFHRGKDADSLLANWTALWHPQLIDNSGQLPSWYRPDTLPAHDQPRLLVRPTSEVPQPNETLAHDVAAAGGQLIDQQDCRASILEQALEAAGGRRPVDEELAADFMALGFAYLQTQLLTRQMRYATRVAETPFADNVIAAAKAALEGDSTAARTLLQSCFDLLSQERNHYYAVDVYLIDLSLVAEPLLGEPMRRQLAASAKSNLLLEAQLLEQLQAHHPASWTALQQAVAEGQVGLIGGEFQEQPVTLLSADTVRRQLENGLREFTERLGARPHVFGRRRFGLAPSLPQMLLRFDFQGALHATFDGGRFPEATQAKSRWEGDGQFSIDAITRAPLDATQPATFLNLATSLAESMDMDHIATRCFVHWAGEVSPWYRELQRVTRFTPALGRFVTVDEYFQQTYDPGIHDRFTADQYRSPWLAQQVAAGHQRPISCCVAYWQHYLCLQSWVNCSVLWLMVQDVAEARDHRQRAEAQMTEFARQPLQPIDGSAADDARQQLRSAAIGLARAVYGARAAAAAEGEGGCVLVNPWSFPRRIGMTDCPVLPAASAPVYAVQSSDLGTRAVADVPALGLSRISGPVAGGQSTRKAPPPLAAEWLLRNEFLEAQLDPATGALLSLRDYRDRNNRLSQQLAYRIPGSSAGGSAPAARYSRMVGDSMQIVEADSIRGRIEARGRLTDQAGQTLADFVQTFQLWRGSRVVEIQIELHPHQQPDGDPWEHYLACRLAWPNEGAELVRGLNDVRQTTSAKRFEAPLFVQIDEGGPPTTLLTGGLPFHRRVQRRMLDTILIAGQEQQRQFRIGLGLELQQPFRDAMAFVAPELVVPLEWPAGGPPSTWLFHLDARHVICTRWQPVWQDDRLVGLRVGLAETEGRRGRVSLRSFRPLSSARKIDGREQTVEICEVDGERLTVNVSPQEQVEVEALFAS